MDNVPALLARIDTVNRKIFEDYQRHLLLTNIGQKTIGTKLYKVYAFLKWSKVPDLREVVPKQFEDFYLHRKETVRPATAFGDLQELRVFYKWLLPGKDVITFRPKRPRNDIPPEKVVTSDLVRKMLECCESQRDRALVSVFWDSAARLNEILDCNIQHIQFDRYGAVISVSGKTGRRPIRLISSVPDLQAWINLHPLKNDPNAPLFVTSRRRGTAEFRRLNERTVDNLFKRLGSFTDTGKRTNPHSLRHGRLTVRGKQLTESELRQYAGWSKGSTMAAVYVHLSSRDIDDKILTTDGVIQEEEPAPDPMAPRICPRCDTQNSPDTLYCKRCSLILDEALAQKMIALDQRIQGDVDSYADWVDEQRKKEK